MIVKLMSFPVTIGILACKQICVNVKKIQSFPEKSPKFVNYISFAQG